MADRKLFGVIIYIVLGFIALDYRHQARSQQVCLSLRWRWWCCTSSQTSPPQNTVTGVSHEVVS